MFTKKGIILNSSRIKWGQNKLWVPTPYKLNKENIIVYFAGQRNNNESDLGYFIFNVKSHKVTFITTKPVLIRGKPGSFDDSAIVPTQIMRYRNNFLLYYVGWMQGKKVPYLPSLGIASSKKLTGPFKKISKGPILDKSLIDPYFVSSCYVEKTFKNRFIMHYTSCVDWIKKNRNFIPKYHLKKCYSNDAVHWKRKGEISLNFKNKKEMAITRPWIINFNYNKYMFFSYKVSSYKIGIAKSTGNTWLRLKKKVFLSKPDYNFDNKSNQYASVIRMNNKFYMFYNGNNYGQKGIALAICNTDDFK